MSTHSDNTINQDFAAKVKATAASILEQFKSVDRLENQPLVAYIRSGEYAKVEEEFFRLAVTSDEFEDDENFKLSFMAAMDCVDPDVRMHNLGRIHLLLRWHDMVSILRDEWMALANAVHNVPGLVWPVDGVAAD